MWQGLKKKEKKGLLVYDINHVRYCKVLLPWNDMYLGTVYNVLIVKQSDSQTKA